MFLTFCVRHVCRESVLLTDPIDMNWFVASRCFQLLQLFWPDEAKLVEASKNLQPSRSNLGGQAIAYILGIRAGLFGLPSWNWGSHLPCHLQDPLPFRMCNSSGFVTTEIWELKGLWIQSNTKLSITYLFVETLMSWSDKNNVILAAFGEHWKLSKFCWEEARIQSQRSF